MTLKTANRNSGQNVPNWRTSAAFTATVKKLSDQNSLVYGGEEAKKQMVKLVEGFAKTVPHGEREEAREALCKKIGRTYRTIKRWKEKSEQREEIGASVFEAAEELDYDITASSIRSLVDAKRLNPGKTPEEIVRKAMNGDALTKAKEARFQEPETTPVQLLEDIVCKYMQDTNDDVDGLFEVLKTQVPTGKLCAVLKGLKCP